MRRIFLLLLLVLAASPVFAGDSIRLGAARIFNNDRIGDRHDRWRSGSYAVSTVRGPAWTGVLPQSAGKILEFRVRSEIIAPANLANPVIGTDRRYAGILAFGVITHFQRGENQISAGVSLVATGPQTGMGQFQTWVHRYTGDVIPAVLGSQIANGFHPTGNIEIAREIELIGGDSGSVRFRPFLEAQAGVETYLRVGGDFTFGNLGRGDLRVRDVVTGQRIIGVRADRAGGFSFVIGADAAKVYSSVYLPVSSGYVLTNTRTRVRGGILYEGAKASVFYGLTWLSKEFAAQPSGQVVGSLAIRMRL